MTAPLSRTETMADAEPVPANARARPAGDGAQPLDRLGRPTRDLRISVTDRCNLRCGYCMPRASFGPGHRFLPHRELLTVDEIATLTEAFMGLGVVKVRLTGGEPLLRAELAEIVARLAGMGIPDLALTTNGVLLDRLAGRLRESGLRRVTVSLDTLDSDVFQRLSDTSVSLVSVLRGIDAAVATGFGPIKLNCVLRRGLNDSGIAALVEYAREGGHVLRFIEFMDVGMSNGWSREQTVPSAEVVERISALHPLEPVAPTHPGEVAQRYRYLDGGGEIGVISSVTQPFCGDCTRARLSADGRMYTCLFAGRGTDLAALVRGGASAPELTSAIAGVWQRRQDRYSELRGSMEITSTRVEMSYIGG